VRSGKSAYVMDAADTPKAAKGAVTTTLSMRPDGTAAPSRSAAAQRRAMQAAMAAAVMALRSHESRRVGWRPPPGGLL
jgi:hypothetical protein